MLEESFHRKREKIARIRQPRSPKRKRIRRSYSSSSRSSNRSNSSSISTTPSWDRSVIATLLPNDIKKKDITNIFTSVGKIENIQLVFCSKSHQFLNKAYIEFANMESVILVGCDFYTLLCKKGGFQIKNKTEIRYFMICRYFIFITVIEIYLILVLISIGNPPIVLHILGPHRIKI